MKKEKLSSQTIHCSSKVTAEPSTAPRLQQKLFKMNRRKRESILPAAQVNKTNDDRTVIVVDKIQLQPVQAVHICALVVPYVVGVEIEVCIIGINGYGIKC